MVGEEKGRTRIEGQWLDIEDRNRCALLREEKCDQFAYPITASCHYDDLLFPVILGAGPVVDGAAA